MLLHMLIKPWLTFRATANNCNNSWIGNSCCAPLPHFTRTSSSSLPVRIHSLAMSSSSSSIDNKDVAAQEWDAVRYQSQHSFVYQYGTSLIDVLNPQPGERILDLGCGTGELTNAISQRYPGSIVVVGIDADATMIARAQQQYSNLDFRLADARSFALHDEEEPMDAIFSNAALHWVPDADRCIARMAAALSNRHGRFVLEFGGKNNVYEIASFLERTCGKDKNPWYFPSIGEYATLLEKHGLEVQSAELYDRPTPLIGDHGLRNWIAMFGGPFLEGVEDKEALFQQAEEELKPKLHNGEHWVADYRRIRITGKKVNASSK